MKKSVEKKCEETIDIVKRIIAETVEISSEEIGDDANLAQDLDLESLDLIDIALAFQKEFDFIIPDQDVKKLQTVKDIVSYIDEAKNK